MIANWVQQPQQSSKLTSADLVMVVSSALTIAAYALLWLRPLWLARFDPFSGPAVAVAPILGLESAGYFHYTVALLLVTVAYVTALAVARRCNTAVSIPAVMAVVALAPLLLLYTYPAFAGDVFDYLMSGRIITEYGGNPYTDLPVVFPHDPYYNPVVWKGSPSPYGPAWQHVAAAITAIAGDDTTRALLLIKLVAVAAHLGTAAFVYFTVRAINPSRAVQALIAYGWHPLPIVYFAVDAHNDALMVLFLTAAVYLAVRQRWELAIPALVLAGMTKYVPFLLLPVFLIEARRQPLRAAHGLLFSLPFVVFLVAPLWSGIDMMAGLQTQSTRFTASPASLLRYVVQDEALRPLGLALFAAGYCITVRYVRGLPARSYAVIMLYVWTCSFWTKEWYLTWPLAMGSMVGGPPFVAASAAGVGGIATPLFGGWGWMMNWWGWQQRWGMWMMDLWLTVPVYGAMLLAWSASVAFRRTWARQPTSLTAPGSAPTPARARAAAGRPPGR